MRRIIAGLWSRRSDSAVSLAPSATKASTIRRFLIRQRWRSFRSILTGTRRRKTPSGWSRAMSNPASRSNSPRWIRCRTPSWPGASASSGRQPPRRLVCPPARQDLHARRLRRIHILVGPTDAVILKGRNGSGPDVGKPETGCHPPILPTSGLRVALASPKAATVSLVARSGERTGSAALRQALRAS